MDTIEFQDPHFSVYRDLSLSEVHQTGRAATSEPTLLKYRRFGDWSMLTALLTHYYTLGEYSLLEVDIEI